MQQQESAIPATAATTAAMKISMMRVLNPVIEGHRSRPAASQHDPLQPSQVRGLHTHPGQGTAQGGQEAACQNL